MASYNSGPMPQAHIDFLKSGQLWIEIENKLFVHAGFVPELPLEKNSAHVLVQDRDLLKDAWEVSTQRHEEQITKCDDIFIGHTTTEMYEALQPFHVCDV